MKTVKILYVLGRGRSGSTVLANILGEIPGFFSAGEVRALWDPVLTTASTCACGATMARCRIWSEVLDHLGDVDVAQTAEWQREVVDESKILRLLRCGEGCDWPALQRYSAVMGRVYRSIQAVTGARVVVDSSKRPSYAALVRLLDTCEPYFVHLTRDPRASAYSWQSRRYASARPGEEVRRRNSFDSTVRWDLLNMGAEAVLRRVPADRQMRLRYEDFATAPLPHVREICRWIGEPGARLPFVDERTVTMSVNHTIAGNPARFRTGEMQIRDTAEWRAKQTLPSRWIAMAVAAPFLRRYGYPFRASASASAGRTRRPWSG